MIFHFIIYYLTFISCVQSNNVPIDSSLINNDTKMDITELIENSVENESDVENMNSTTLNLTAIGVSSNEDMSDQFACNITDHCNETNCVRKCCPQGMLSLGRKCEPTEDETNEWLPGISNISVVCGSPATKHPEVQCLIYGIEELEWLPSGSVVLKRNLDLFTFEYYCYDVFQLSDNISTPRVALCKEGFLKENTGDVKLIIKSGNAISIVFLLFLIVAHLFNPLMRSKLYDKCFLSMCIALFFGYIFLLCVQMDMVNDISDSFCVALGMFVQYFFLSFNFWLNLRCFETLRIVRGVFKGTPPAQLNASKHRFLTYSLCCWGIPFLISSATLIMQTLPEGTAESFRPHLAKTKCWFIHDLLILGLYYYGYQLILHILNLLYMGTSFFLLVMSGDVQLCVFKKTDEDAALKRNRKGIKVFWQQFFIFLVWVVMLSLDSMTLLYPEVEFWHYIDLANTLSGVYLFLIYLLSTRTRKIMSQNSRTSPVNTNSSKISLQDRNLNDTEISPLPPIVPDSTDTDTIHPQ